MHTSFSKYLAMTAWHKRILGSYDSVGDTSIQCRVLSMSFSCFSAGWALWRAFKGIELYLYQIIICFESNKKIPFLHHFPRKFIEFLIFFCIKWLSKLKTSCEKKNCFLNLIRGIELLKLIKEFMSDFEELR